MEEKPKTRRDRYKIEPTQKTRVEKATDEIVKRTLEVLCKEDVFPKRSRWLIPKLDSECGIRRRRTDQSDGQILCAAVPGASAVQEKEEVSIWQ